MQNEPKVLLFDLGGVVIDIDFNRVFEVWAGLAGCSGAEIRGRFRMDDRYKAHETGTITEAEFYAGLRQSLQISLTDAQFRQGWNAIFKGEVAGIGALLAQLAPHYALYAFSNTNETHRRHMMAHYAAVLGHFRHVFISSDMGVRKPDAAAFQWVIRDLQVAAADILFFDDTQENVDGAKACGLQSVLVKSLKDVENAGITRS